MDKKPEGVCEIAFPLWTAYRANLQLVRWSILQIVICAAFVSLGVYLAYLWSERGHALQLSDVLLLGGCLLFTPLVLLLALLPSRRNPLSTGPFVYKFDASGRQDLAAYTAERDS